MPSVRRGAIIDDEWLLETQFAYAEPGAAVFRIGMLLYAWGQHEHGSRVGLFLGTLAFRNVYQFFTSINRIRRARMQQPGGYLEPGGLGSSSMQRRSVGWMLTEGAMNFAPPLAAGLVYHRHEIINSNDFAMTIYPAAFIILLWTFPDRRRISVGRIWRFRIGQGLALATLALAIPIWLLTAALNGYSIASPQVYVSFSADIASLVCALLLGIGLTSYVRRTVESALEREAIRRSTFESQLHSVFKTQITMVRHALDRKEATPVIRKCLAVLATTVEAERIDQLLEGPICDLGSIAAHWCRFANDWVSVEANIPAKGIEITPEAAALVSQSLGDLLSNAIKHGGTNCKVDTSYSRLSIAVSVTDDGPGFVDSNDVWHGDGGLARLRFALQTVGGSLSWTNATDGTEFNAVVPR
jgi:signal transduction histidine kinase